MEGRQIWVYAENRSAATSLDEVARGVEAAVKDAGLNLKVVAKQKPPPYFQQSLAAALVQHKEEARFDYWRYAATLARVRTGQHADVVVIDHWFAIPDWAHGMAVFNLGLAVLTDNFADFHTAKHETIHMLGYHLHDVFPVWVIGYPDEPWWCLLTGRPRREGLMQLLGSDDALRQRTRTALREFWRTLDQKLLSGR